MSEHTAENDAPACVIEERGRVYDRCSCGWYGTLGDSHVLGRPDPRVIPPEVDQP